MRHLRREIRRECVAQLEGQLEGVPVTDASPRSFVAPSVQVVTAAEAVAERSLDGLSETRVVSVLVIIRAKGEDIQGELDALAELVEAAIPSSLLGFETIYQTTEIELDSQQGDRLGSATVTFDVLTHLQGNEQP